MRKFQTMTPHWDLMHDDPRVVDKVLASELNSLSFDDREALVEEVHGVRSLAREETPGMIKDALLDLQREIDKQLSTAISSYSSSSLDKSKSYNIHSIRQEYLHDLLIASQSSVPPIPFPDKHCSDSMQSQNSPHSSLNMRRSLEESAIVSDNEESNTPEHKYSYALSRRFLIKFLRAELFDIKKAAARYINCIDFLVECFGLSALERPLFLKDLNRDEQKLLKDGRCQLMPSRDRFGRRIIVFLGAFGKDFSHRNAFRVCTYLVFQVASDDEMTQRNGLVAIYSRHENDLKTFMKMAIYQNLSMKYFDAVPLRYSAFHCFLPNEMEAIKGIMLNSIGMKTRVITRVHTVSSMTETYYKLRCFGIPTEDFPVTSSGSIKKKRLMKWIKFRNALEESQHRGERIPFNQLQHPVSPGSRSPNHGRCPSPSSPFLGIECPQLDHVIFRNGGSAWDHPGNVKFRSILTSMEPDREFQKTMAEKGAFLDRIITELFSSGLTFLVYDDANDWYVELKDYDVLRKKVFQALRDQSARRKRTKTGKPGERRRRGSSKGRKITTHQVNESSTSLFVELDHSQHQSSAYSRKMVGKDIKRQKLCDSQFCDSWLANWNSYAYEIRSSDTSVSLPVDESGGGIVYNSSE